MPWASDINKDLIWGQHIVSTSFVFAWFSLPLPVHLILFLFKIRESIHVKCVFFFFFFDEFQIILRDRTQEKFVDIISDRCSEVGLYCEQADLISENDCEELRLTKFEGSSGGDRLLQLLRGTGNTGFYEFLRILAKWNLPAAPAQLLKMIKEKLKELNSSWAPAQLLKDIREILKELNRSWRQANQ